MHNARNPPGAIIKHFNTATMEFFEEPNRVDEGTGEKVVRPRNKL